MPSEMDTIVNILARSFERKKSLERDQIMRDRNMEDYEKRQQYMDPMQEMMARQYMEQNPDTDFSGISGLEAIEKRYKAKRKSQFPFQKDEGKESDGKGKQSAGKAADPFYQPIEPQVTMSSGGFGTKTPTRKEFVYNKIAEKVQAGIPPSESEDKFVKGYLGVREDKKSSKNITVKDRLNVRKLAIDMIRNEVGQSMDPDEASSYLPTEDEISQKIPEAAQYLLPNVKDFVNEPLDIKFPKSITQSRSASKALEYMVNTLVMEEEDARQWLKSRTQRR